MKLRKIELNNFRQFYAEQYVEFSISDKQNVTLIHAENGTGKTAFLNAILWCFFEDTTSNFKDPTVLLNKQAKDNGKSNYSVKIEFLDDNGQTYLATRSFGVAGKRFTVHKLEGNSYSEVDNPNSFINSIIPKEISKYFFFQGEGIGKVSGSKGSSPVKKAIREILGFTVAEIALEDLRSIKRTYQKDLSNADRTGKISEVQEKINYYEDEISKSKERVARAEAAVSTFQSSLEEIDEKLRNCNSEVIKQLHNRRVLIEDSLDRERKRLKATNADKVRLVSEYATAIFGYDISKQALDFIDEQEYQGRVPAPYNEQLVKDILKEATCICGSDIQPGTEAYQRITDMLKQASDPMLENRVRRARSQLTSIQNSSVRAKNKILANMESTSSSENQITQLENDLREISISIQGAEDLNSIIDLEKERARINASLQAENRAQGAASSVIDRLVPELERAKSEIRRLDTFSDQVNYFKKLVEFTEKTEEVIASTLVKAEKDVERLIIEKVNKYLTEFVRQDYKAKLNPTTFEIRLVDSRGRIVPESDGQALLLSLTFISSLIELSRERKGAAGQILTPGAIAPFVIDAPFGDLDNKYKGNVASAIPNSVEQVILLLSSSHWEGTVDQSVRDRIGKEYNMVLEVTAPSNGKELDTIEIQGKQFDTVRYNQGIERTVIEEVSLNG